MDSQPEITFAIASTDEHFAQILNLQQANLFRNLTPAGQVSSGFVFAEHTPDILKQMAAGLPQLIALSAGRVIGYNLSMSEAMKNYLPGLTPMFLEFSTCRFLGAPLSVFSFIVGGQVCIDTAFRGRGLIGSLYGETFRLLKSKYRVCVTEISTRNLVSLKAHEKIGFKLIHTYSDLNENWNIVAMDIGRALA